MLIRWQMEAPRSGEEECPIFWHRKMTLSSTNVSGCIHSCSRMHVVHRPQTSLQTSFNDMGGVNWRDERRTEATNWNNFWEHSSSSWGETINIDEKLTFKVFFLIFLLFLWCWQLFEHEHKPVDDGMDREHNPESLADLALLFWRLRSELREAFSYKSAL